jgi:hypothetical protein
VKVVSVRVARDNNDSDILRLQVHVLVLRAKAGRQTYRQVRVVVAFSLVRSVENEDTRLAGVLLPVATPSPAFYLVVFFSPKVLWTRDTLAYLILFVV